MSKLYVNLVHSTEDLRLEGEEGDPQAQAAVVFNPAIHHSDKPFIDSEVDPYMAQRFSVT